MNATGAAAGPAALVTFFTDTDHIHYIIFLIHFNEETDYKVLIESLT